MAFFYCNQEQLYVLFRFTGVAMIITRFRLLLFLCCILAAAGCASEADIRAQMLVYKNSEFGFVITFPENWQSYRVVDSKEYIAADLKVRVFHICLPTRSQEWQSGKVASPYAVMFTIYIFTPDSWKLYSEKYAAGGSGDTVLGKSEKYIFMMRYPAGLPIDLNQFMKEIDRVVAKFRIVQ